MILKTFIRLLTFSIFLICCLTLGSCQLFKSKKPNVIFLMLDTLRADHLGIYGYERNTSPNIDQFARENLLFKNAITAVPWTPPSVAGMLSGLYPTSHNFMPPNSREEATSSVSKLSDAVLTLPEVLKAQGYQTHAISSNPWITDTFGFNQGYEKFEYLEREQADIITDSGIKAIDQMSAKDQPFFLYLHYLDPHEPYTPPNKYVQAFKGPLKSREYDVEMQRKIGLYDGEIAFMDECLGKLFTYLKEKNLYENSIIVIVGDHGEQFMEHGNISHGNELFNPELHVPMMIKTGKQVQQRVVDYAVSNIDLFPTILDLVGLVPPTNYQSVSLVKDENSQARGGVLSEIKRKYNQRSFTKFDGQRLLVGSRSQDLTVDAKDAVANSIGVFDSFKDIWEEAPIENPELLKQLQAEFQAELQKSESLKVKSATGDAVDETTISQLESLGYLK